MSNSASNIEATLRYISVSHAYPARDRAIAAHILDKINSNEMDAEKAAEYAMNTLSIVRPSYKTN
ncbi:MAG: hypothetical protein OXD33_12440 [Rhodobacteraceae bacterium]|nr:hypothetical protein [Paracoccaceae bacterium]